MQLTTKPVINPVLVDKLPVHGMHKGPLPNRPLQNFIRSKNYTRALASAEIYCTLVRKHLKIIVPSQCIHILIYIKINLSINAQYIKINYFFKLAFLQSNPARPSTIWWIQNPEEDLCLVYYKLFIPRGVWLASTMINADKNADYMFNTENF